MITTCRDSLLLIRNEKSNLGSLQLVFLIIFWKLTKYQHFRAKSCRIQQPYTKNTKNETKYLEKKLTLHYRPVSMCLLSSKTCPKPLFVWTVKWPHSKFGPLISEFNNLTLKISKMRLSVGKKFWHFITDLSHCACYCPKHVRKWFLCGRSIDPHTKKSDLSV